MRGKARVTLEAGVIASPLNGERARVRGESVPLD